MSEYSLLKHPKKILRKKSHNANPLVSAGNVCYAEEKEKPFWFSWLGQMVQFDTINSWLTWRFILVTSGVSKKTLTKSHDYSRLISIEKRRLKAGENGVDNVMSKQEYVLLIPRQCRCAIRLQRTNVLLQPEVSYLESRV